MGLRHNTKKREKFKCTRIGFGLCIRMPAQIKLGLPYQRWLLGNGNELNYLFYGPLESFSIGAILLVTLVNMHNWENMKVSL